MSILDHLIFLKENKYFRKFIVRVSTQLVASHFVGNKHCKQNGRFTFRDNSIGRQWQSQLAGQRKKMRNVIPIVSWTL